MRLDSTRTLVALTTGTRLASTLTTAATVAVLARTYGAEGVGLLALSRSVPAIFALLVHVGVPSATSWLVNNQKHDAQRAYASLHTFTALSALAGVALWLAFTPLLSTFVFKSQMPSDVMLLSLMLPFSLHSDLADSFLRAVQRFHYSNLLRLVPELILLLAVLVLQALDLETRRIIVCVILARALGAAIASASLAGSGIWPRVAWHKEILGQALRFGRTIQVGRVASVLNYRLDHVILAVLMDEAAVGVYAIASKCAEFLRMFPTSVRDVVEPRIARRSVSDAVARTKRALRIVVSLTTVAVLVAAVVGPPLIQWLFDEWSEAAVLPFQILLLGVVGLAGNSVISAYNLGHGMPVRNTLPVAIGLVVTIILDALLIPIYHVNGAAVASACAYTVTAIIMLGQFFAQPTATP